MELETNVPPFLLPRILAGWRLENQQNLGSREERWEKVSISGPINLEGKDLGNIGSKYQFQTSEGKPWCVILGREKPFLNKEILLPSNLSTEFELRQQFPSPNNQSEINRQQAQDFLAANWAKIAKIFYSNPDEADWRENSHLPVFTNVRLDENRIIDVVAFGPDGRIFIFNFGPQDPNLSQVIKDLIKEMKLESQVGVTIVNGLISFTNQGNNLILNNS